MQTRDLGELITVVLLVSFVLSMLPQYSGAYAVSMSIRDPLNADSRGITTNCLTGIQRTYCTGSILFTDCLDQKEGVVKRYCKDGCFTNGMSHCGRWISGIQ